MSGSEAALIAVAAFFAGAMNAIAGGGTFLSFPALLAAGVPPVMANASNAVALWPASLSSAYAFRRELKRHRGVLAGLSLAALVGGAAGGLLLLATSDRSFSALIPWLMLTATLLFAASGRISAWLDRRRGQRRRSGPLATLFQLAVSVYGGFFGAGMGIVMIAALAIQGHEDPSAINAIKNWLSSIIYSVAVLTFVTAGAVSWPHTAVMLVAATLGGYGGAAVSRRVPAPLMRRLIVAIGSLLTINYFLEFYG